VTDKKIPAMHVAYLVARLILGMFKPIKLKLVVLSKFRRTSIFLVISFWSIVGSLKEFVM